MTAFSKTQFTTGGMVALASSFAVSAVTIATGASMHIVGTSQSTAAQIGANDGSIADATQYYQQLGSATSLTSAGTMLLGAGVLGLTVLLGMLALAWRGPSPTIDADEQDQEFPAVPLTDALVPPALLPEIMEMVTEEPPAQPEADEALAPAKAGATE